MLDYHLFLTLASLLLCSLLFARSIVLRRRAAAHSDLLYEQQIALQKYQEELSQIEQSVIREQYFKTSLQQAEVTTELQKSRISFHQDRQKLKVPERYAYVQSMFRSGMQTEDVALTLGMSCHEISQLRNLSALAENTNRLGRKTNVAAS
ncbi:MAG: hypothetical protein KKD01_18395 [Proteobacteria bacterium]|nr:hypothetical protein [Pseudomonadota bacterium]MBU1231586.1 hypothetical protein [Pseudomonadota bacterium]MBU1416937.1 hypothetical protein [Pseudomonadota bacterium]MBU1456690.1 hypothetical protein [Pseudomonadota bacterium]